MLTVPRAVLVRYVPSFVIQLLRGARHRLAQSGPGRRPLRHMFVFGGRSTYWPQAGRELYAREPAFRAAVEECERILVEELDGPSVLSQFTGAAGPGFWQDEPRLLHFTVVMQLALVQLWRAHGVQPGAVLGISGGEIAAVYAAGGLSLSDALRVSACRGLTSELEPRQYRALAVGSGFAAAGPLAAGSPVELAIVLVMDENACLAFCQESDLTQAQAYLAAHEIESEIIRADPIWPYHAPRVARHLSVLHRSLAGLVAQPLAVPCYLGTLGRQVPAGGTVGTDFWLMGRYYPVLLHTTLSAALADGYKMLTVIGTDPFPFFKKPLAGRLGTAQLLGALQQEESEWATFRATRRELKRQRVKPGVPLLVAPSALAPTAPMELANPEFVANPYPVIAWLRRRGGIHPLPSEASWLVLDADLVQAVLRQPDIFSSHANAEFDSELLGADPPLHTGNRALFQAFFAPRELAALADYTAAMMQELMQGLQGRASFDFVAEFAIPLTQAVGGQLLGLTRTERTALQACLPGHAYEMGYLVQLTTFFEEYFDNRALPASPPVMLDLLLGQQQRGELTRTAALGLTKTLWLAGIVTSSMLLSSAVHYLFTYPHLAEQLRAQPELIDSFVEEILRLESPLKTFWRNTTKPTALGGQLLPANSQVICSMAAANRDPARYPHPDEVDLTRRGRHLAFGGGIHACLGAHLARLEARIVVRWVLDQGPAIRLTNPFALPEYFPSGHFRALAILPLTFRAPVSA